MAYQTGTVTGVPALIDAIKAFAVANNWVAVKEIDDTLQPPKLGELILQRDIEDGRPITVGFQHNYNVASDYYNLNLMTSVGFDSLNPEFDEQPYGFEMSVCMYQLDIEYHLMINDRRILIGFICGGVYDMLYVGRYLSYASPDQMPQPDMCAGNNGYNSTKRYSEVSRNGIYLGATARIYSDFVGICASGFKQKNGWSTSEYIGDQSGHQLYNLCIEDDSIYHGEWEGIYGISGIAMTTGTTFTIGSTNYIVFQNRQYSDINDFFALELK